MVHTRQTRGLERARAIAAGFALCIAVQACASGATWADPDYRWVLYGEDDRNLGWIYSRTPTIDDATYASLLEQFRRRGYDTSRFRKIIQRPGQIGQPGFWSDGVAG